MQHMKLRVLTLKFFLEANFLDFASTFLEMIGFLCWILYNWRQTVETNSYLPMSSYRFNLIFQFQSFSVFSFERFSNHLFGEMVRFNEEESEHESSKWENHSNEGKVMIKR